MKRPPPEHSLRRMCMLIRSDAARYERARSCRGFWATMTYRVRRTRRYGGPAAKLLIPLDLLLWAFRPWMGDFEIISSAEIGPGFHLPHPNGVMIGPCRIGPQVTVFQQVTIGSWKNEFPLIRAFASLFGGSRVLGGVVIGRRAFIGANTVVTKHIPDYHTAIGCPVSMLVAPQPRAVAGSGRKKADPVVYRPDSGKVRRPSRSGPPGLRR